VDPYLHPDEEQLEYYVRGRLPSSEVPLLEEHLLYCSACRDRLDEVERFILGMKEALRMEYASVPSASAEASWLAWLRKPAFSMALAVVALIAAIAIYSGRGSNVAPVAALQLTAIRGELPTATPARELDLTLADAPRDSGPYRVELFNAQGQAVWSGLTQSGPAGVTVKAEQRLGPGDYFLRLYSASGEVQREYGFRIRQ
jgi:hypothetical protein